MKIKIIVLFLMILSISHYGSSMDKKKEKAFLKSINVFLERLKEPNIDERTRFFNQLVSEEGLKKLLSLPLRYKRLNDDYFDGTAKDHPELRQAYHSAIFEGAKHRADNILRLIRAMESKPHFERLLRNLLPGLRRVVKLMEEQLKIAEYYKASFTYPECFADLHVESFDNEGVLRKFKFDSIHYELVSREKQKFRSSKTEFLLKNPQEIAKFIHGVVSPNIFIDPLLQPEPHRLPQDFLELAIFYHTFVRRAVRRQKKLAYNLYEFVSQTHEEAWNELTTIKKKHNRLRNVALKAISIKKVLVPSSHVNKASDHERHDEYDQHTLSNADNSENHLVYMHSNKAEAGRKRTKLEDSHEWQSSSTDGIGQVEDRWEHEAVAALGPSNKKFKLTGEAFAETGISELIRNTQPSKDLLASNEQNVRQPHNPGTGLTVGNPLVNNQLVFHPIAYDFCFTH